MEYVEIDLEIVTITDDAILTDDGDDEYWIPRSQIEDGEEIDWGDIGKTLTLNIAEWFAEKEGLI